MIIALMDGFHTGMIMSMRGFMAVAVPMIMMLLMVMVGSCAWS